MNTTSHIRACHDLLDMIALCNLTLDNMPLLTITYKVLTKCLQSAYIVLTITYKVLTKCLHRVLTMCLQSAHKMLTDCLQSAHKLLTSEASQG